MFIRQKRTNNFLVHNCERGTIVVVCVARVEGANAALEACKLARTINDDDMRNETRAERHGDQRVQKRRLRLAFRAFEWRGARRRAHDGRSGCRRDAAFWRLFGSDRCRAGRGFRCRCRHCGRRRWRCGRRRLLHTRVEARNLKTGLRLSFLNRGRRSAFDSC